MVRQTSVHMETKGYCILHVLTLHDNHTLRISNNFCLLVGFLFFVCLLEDRLYIFGYPGTHYIDVAGLNFTEICQSLPPRGIYL